MQSNKGAVKKQPTATKLQLTKKISSNSVLKEPKNVQKRDSSNDRLSLSKDQKSITTSRKEDGKISNKNKVRTEKLITGKSIGVSRSSSITNSTSRDNNNSRQITTKSNVTLNKTTPRTSMSKPVIKSTTDKLKKPASNEKLSSRVSVTQFFPGKSKDLPSTGLNSRVGNVKEVKSSEKSFKSKNGTKPSLTERSNLISKSRTPRESTKTDLEKKVHVIRSRSRTLHPDEIRVLSDPANVVDVAYSSSNVPVKPKTVNKKTEIKDRVETKNTEYKVNSDNEEQSSNSYNYDDDFESYESDFEEYSSSKSSESDNSGPSSVGSLTDDTSSSSSNEVIEPLPVIKVSAVNSLRKNAGADKFNNEVVGTKVLTVENTIQKRNSIVEEEKKLDSGNYDLREAKRAKMLRGIEEAIEKENSSLNSKPNSATKERNETSLSDEGFEEGGLKSMQLNNSPFINFSKACKKEQKIKNLKNNKKRAQDILSMITFDTMYIPLFEMMPVPYEIFMQSYGQRDAIQVSSQTNDDALSEETQTDDIEVSQKWTQHPVKYTLVSNHVDSNVNDVHIFMHEHLGVENDTNIKPDLEKWIKKSKFDLLHLNKFIESAGQIMLILLEESFSKTSEKFHNSQKNIPFSSGHVTLKFTNVSFLTHRPVTKVCWSEKEHDLLLTIHKNSSDTPKDVETQIFFRSLICVWNILEPSAPQKILVASDDITACCFDADSSSLVFAGFHNGGLCIWDLREPSLNHQRVKTESGLVFDVRSPTYISDPEKFSEGHQSQVVSVKCLNESQTDDLHLFNINDLVPSQLCSLEENGILIIWSVIQAYKPPGLLSQDQGLAHWGRIRLIRSQSISLHNLIPELGDNFTCHDMHVDGSDQIHLYIATNSGYVLHCLKSGSTARPMLYSSNEENPSFATCIETCPHKQPYFLVGCADGSIRLHSRHVKNSLITLYGMDETGSGQADNQIKIIQWSRHRPCMFYLVDSKNTIHIWDLQQSDIYPMYSVPFQKNITSVQLSPHLINKESFMAISTADGEVELHQIVSEFSYKSEEDYKNELNKFLLYVDLL